VTRQSVPSTTYCGLRQRDVVKDKEEEEEIYICSSRLGLIKFEWLILGQNAATSEQTNK
jgi:hypothetical protein